MKKRTFLKLSSAMVAGSIMAPLAACSTDEKKMKLTNWAGNLQYSTDHVIEPQSTEAVAEAIVQMKKLRALGTRHCFNTIADSSANLLSTRNLNQVINLDTDGFKVTVGAGMRYGELCTILDQKGFAIHNLASLPHISIAGACATATHGSGVKNGNLATAVSGLEIVNGKGEVITITREKDQELLEGAVVGLGSLGVVTQVTLDLLPTFSMYQRVFLNLPVDALKENFDAIMSSGYSVSLFTDWQSDTINQVWIKKIAFEGELPLADDEFYGATAATKNVHPIIELSAENCTEQMGVIGPWYERLPHFKMGFTPSNGEELQAEYFVPYEHAFDAIQAVAQLRTSLRDLLLITEIRTIAADQLWMSPCYHQQSVTIHFTLKRDVEGVTKLLPQIEEKLSPYNVKPHWGKLFTLSPATLQSRYERLDDFKQLVHSYDPEGKFVNTFIHEQLGIS